MSFLIYSTKKAFHNTETKSELKGFTGRSKGIAFFQKTHCLSFLARARLSLENGQIGAYELTVQLYSLQRLLGEGWVLAPRKKRQLF